MSSWTFTSRGMSLDRRVGFMQDRVAYMAGFGIPATLITSFGPPLVNMAIFALLYPIVSLSHLLILSERLMISS
jgi:etoposide-induced 2.4 mRNA